MMQFSFKREMVIVNFIPPSQDLQILFFQFFFLDVLKQNIHQNHQKKKKNFYVQDQGVLKFSFQMNSKIFDLFHLVLSQPQFYLTRLYKSLLFLHSYYECLFQPFQEKLLFKLVNGNKLINQQYKQYYRFKVLIVIQFAQLFKFAYKESRACSRRRKSYVLQFLHLYSLDCEDENQNYIVLFVCVKKYGMQIKQFLQNQYGQKDDFVDWQFL
eukprot:TRINITY_DN56961_c0_g1_i5.p2 TRINITY_DN56961_c0_g1~~TRINITY_DN56961_c0_g1_i5.p2  ORF type:complete len:212 (-),score=-3.72 TRINITY_DN56961_c0_g1_i5:319-954(-)